jgi:NTP pyrophosphatase (non-canonical NTP hydrolase)
MTHIQLKPINTLAQKHFNWIQSKNWNSKSQLESIALIGSEIGEAFQEVFSNNNELLEFEIADIYLRTINLAIENNMDLDKERANQFDYYIKLNLSKYGSQILEHLAYLTIPLAQLANTTRYEKLPPEFNTTLICFLLTIEKICNFHNIPLLEKVEQKIIINQTKDHAKRIK